MSSWWSASHAAHSAREANAMVGRLTARSLQHR
jgi:hypothetical protein